MSNRYTQGICHDGAAILFDGHKITVDQIVKRLNAFYSIEQLLMDSPYLDCEDHGDYNLHLLEDAVVNSLNIARSACED